MWIYGVIAWYEKLMGRRVYWVICTIHCNELPLRHLIHKMDGPTKGKDGLSGPMGKLLPNVNTMKRNFHFKAIPGLEDLREIPSNVVEKMSNDDSLFYQLGLAIRSGVLSKELENRKVGTLVHSQWLTTALAIGMLWVRDHGLEGQELRVFEMITTYAFQVYHHMFFEIMVLHGIVHAPYHVLTLLRLVRQHPKEVIDIVMLTMAQWGLGLGSRK